VNDAFHEWLDGLSGPKRNLYLQGYSDLPNTNREIVKRDLFVKRENNIKGKDQHNPNDKSKAVRDPDDWLHYDIYPRAIQSGKKYPNLALGPFVSSFTKALEKMLLDIQSDFVVVYTKTPAQTAKLVITYYSTFEDPITISEDFVRADASTTMTQTGQLAEVLTACGAPAIVEALIEEAKIVRGVSRHGVKYYAEGGTTSGSQNTTLNHITTSYCSHTLFKKRYPDVRLVCFNKSDDNLIIMERKHCHLYGSLVFITQTLGMNVTSIWSQQLVGAEFLSLRIFDARTPFALPKIGRTMSKLCWTVYPTKISDPHDHIATVCYGLRHLVPAPIIGPFLTRLMQLTPTGRIDYEALDDEPWKHNWEGNPIDREVAIAAYVDLYSTTREEIFELERQLLAIPAIPYVFHNRLMDRIIKIDLGMQQSQLELDSACLSDLSDIVMSSGATMKGYTIDIPPTHDAFIQPMSLSASISNILSAAQGFLQTNVPAIMDFLSHLLPADQLFK